MVPTIENITPVVNQYRRQQARGNMFRNVGQQAQNRLNQGYQSLGQGYLSTNAGQQAQDLFQNLDQDQNRMFQDFQTTGQQGQGYMFQSPGQQGQNDQFQNMGQQRQANARLNVGQQAQDNQFQVIRDTNAQTTGQQESGTRGITIVLERLKPRMAELTSCAPKQCQQLIPQVTSDLGQLNAFTPTTQIQGDDASVDYTLSQGRQDLIGCGSRLNSADDLKNLADVARKVTFVLNRYQ